ncbi:MAG: DegT/DnrJ/EryC1/StrS family aminotransferase [Pseudomonadota bacterium]
MNGVANLSLYSDTGIGRISFIDLAAQQRRIRVGVEARLKAVLDHGRYIAGPEIEELEMRLAERAGVAGAVACASGTAALIIPLFAMGVGPGDAVFIPAFTYNATANAVLLVGAKPVFVDIDPTTFNMDPCDLAEKVAAVSAEGALRPRAVIPVDLFGSPADYASIAAVAAKYDLSILADGAQSFGGSLNGVEVGALARLTATSFFPGKALGAYGDAGAVFATNPDDLEELASIRWHGTDDARKLSVRVGFNGRMDSFQAAVLLEKLDIFDDELEARRRVAETYDARLSGFAKPQRHLKGAIPGCAYYSLCVDDRDRIVDRVKAAGVPTAIYYATPLHEMPAFKAYAPKDGLPVTDEIASKIFALPMHPYLTPDQVDYICEVTEAAAS